MNIEEIRKKLHEKANTEYRDFNSKLCKDTNKKILGLKVPELRSLAKEIAKDTDAINIIDLLDMEVFEETMLKGLIIAYLKMDIKEKIPLIKAFIPNMDSWALTDTFCPTLKIKEKDLEFIWNFILPYTKSEKEFEVRFAIIMMLDYFVIDEYIEKMAREILDENPELGETYNQTDIENKLKNKIQKESLSKKDLENSLDEISKQIEEQAEGEIVRGEDKRIG